MSKRSYPVLTIFAGEIICWLSKSRYIRAGLNEYGDGPLCEYTHLGRDLSQTLELYIPTSMNGVKSLPRLVQHKETGAISLLLKGDKDCPINLGTDKHWVFNLLYFDADSHHDLHNLETSPATEEAILELKPVHQWCPIKGWHTSYE